MHTIRIGRDEACICSQSTVLCCSQIIVLLAHLLLPACSTLAVALVHFPWFRFSQYATQGFQRSGEVRAWKLRPRLLFLSAREQSDCRRLQKMSGLSLKHFQEGALLLVRFLPGLVKLPIASRGSLLVLEKVLGRWEMHVQHRAAEVRTACSAQPSFATYVVPLSFLGHDHRRVTHV